MLNSKTGIPLRLHQFWIEPGQSTSAEAKLHEDVAILSQTWRESLENCKVWSSDEVQAMILEDLGPAKEKLYSNCIIPAMRADIARVFLVWKFGGIYIDVRWILFGKTTEDRSNSWTKLKAILDEHTFVGLEIRTSNGNILTQNSFFAAPANHPILENTLNLQFEFINTPNPRFRDVWWLTGSQLMKTLKDWSNKSEYFLIPYTQTILAEKKCFYKKNPAYRWQRQQSLGLYYQPEILPLQLKS